MERDIEHAAVTRWKVLEVHNFGGFFGGDTVTLTAARWQDQDEETFTIDEKALVNLPERHLVAPSMVFDLMMSGDRVDRAELVGADDWAVLDGAFAMPPPSLDGPRIVAYHCESCGLWVVGAPSMAQTVQLCVLCGTEL